ncbi:hypothetical protein KY284_035603 [Solanum tuberosum]|nr:hypothetical protein KY284_035603 [Solanum tuberosum]
MFIATRTKPGKKIQADTKVAIAKLQNRQNSEERTDDAFRAVFGKEQLGQLRCYGRSVTTSSLKEDKETNKLKQKHVNEISSLKKEMNEMREEMRHFFTQLLQNNPELNVQDIPGVFGSNLVSPVDASSAQAVRGQNIPHSSGSTHDPVLQKVFCWFLKVIESVYRLYDQFIESVYIVMEILERVVNTHLSVFRKRWDKNRQSCVILEAYVQSRSTSRDWIFEADEHAQLKDK